MEINELLKNKKFWMIGGGLIILYFILTSRKTSGNSSGVDSDLLQAQQESSERAAERKDAYNLEVLRLGAERDMSQLQAATQLEYLKFLTSAELARANQQYGYESQSQRDAYNRQLRNDLVSQLGQGLSQLLQRLGQSGGGRTSGSSGGTSGGSSAPSRVPSNQQSRNPIQSILDRLFNRNRPVVLPDGSFDSSWYQPSIDYPDLLYSDWNANPYADFGTPSWFNEPNFGVFDPPPPEPIGSVDSWFTPTGLADDSFWNGWQDFGSSSSWNYNDVYPNGDSFYDGSFGWIDYYGE